MFTAFVFNTKSQTTQICDRSRGLVNAAFLLNTQITNIFILHFIYGVPMYHLSMFYNTYIAFIIKNLTKTFMFQYL